MKSSWVVVGVVLLGVGCESAEQKCEVARGAAVSEWNGYVSALEADRAKAAAAQKSAALMLSTDIDKRLSPLARQRADHRYPPGSEAWLRASKSAWSELCEADDECRAQRRQNLEAGAALSDLDERLVLARAARDAARGDVAQAGKASAAAILHPEYPQLKQAQALVDVLRQRCEGLPVKQDETVSAVH